jgi:hypothetical protein
MDQYNDQMIEELEDELISLSGFGSFRIEAQKAKSPRDFMNLVRVASKAEGLCKDVMFKILQSAHSKLEDGEEPTVLEPVTRG